MLKRVLIYIFVCANLSAAIAQSKKKKKDDDGIEKYIPTENLDMKKDANHPKNEPDRKAYDYIYKESLDGILYGNPCALEETRRMGFEYIVEKETLYGSAWKSDTSMNNFLVNLKLIFTRSPFWKLILNKRLKECREKTGDFVG